MATADEVNVNLNLINADYLRRLTQSEKAFATTLNKMGADAVRAGQASSVAFNKFTGSFDQIAAKAPRAEKALRGTAKATEAVKFQTANVSSQFQDIAVQLGSGTSWTTIALQQIPQITAATGTLGGTLNGLTSTFKQLFSVQSIALAALIYAGSKAVEYFTSISENGAKSEETLRKEAALIQEIADKWGDALPALKKYADERKRLEDEGKLKEGVQASIEGVYAELAERLPALAADAQDLREKLEFSGISLTDINALQAAMDNLDEKIRNQTATSDDALKMADQLSQLYKNTHIPAAKSLADVYRNEVARSLAAAATEARKLRDELDETLKLQRQGVYTDANAGFYPTVNLPGEAPTPDRRVDPYFEEGAQEVEDALKGLAGTIENYTDQVVQAESGGKTNAKNPNSSATGLGQFISSTFLSLFKREMPALAKGLSDAQILEYRKNGDISRQLIKAYAEDNAKYLAKFGLAVNEASLHLAHFLGPDGARAILQAAPGTPVSQILGQQAIQANPTILGAGKTREDVLNYANRRANFKAIQEETDARQKQQDVINKTLESLRAEGEELKLERETLGASTYERERALIIQETENRLKQQGITITAELHKQIVALAEGRAQEAAAMEKAKVASDEYKASQQEVLDIQEDLNSTIQGAFSGFLQDLRQGKSGSEALANALEKVAAKLLDIGTNLLFNGGGGGFLGVGGGGGIGGIFKLLGFAKGTANTGGRRGEVRGLVHGQEAVIPLGANGKIPIQMPKMTVPASDRGGGETQVRTKVEVVKGDMFDAIVETVSERVSARTTRAGLGQYDKNIRKTMGKRMLTAQRDSL
jgi:hypothetical protein